MSKVWPKVRLGEVLRLDLDRVPVDPSVSYPIVGVLSFGRGLFDREPIENGNTSYKYFHRLKGEHVVMSQLFGWEGALALSNDKFSGKFLSPQFPTFLCNSGKLDRQFLGWLMRRKIFWDDLGSRTTGMGDRRRTLNPEALFACEIPLPPLSEQQRIVARIEELGAQINDARAIKQQVVKDSNILLISLAHRPDLSEGAKIGSGWLFLQLSDVISHVAESIPVIADESYPNFGIYSFGRGLFPKPPIEGALTSAKSLRRVRENQFIYSRLFAFEGAYGMVTKQYDGAFISNEYPTFNCDNERIRPEFLVAYFKSPGVWATVAAGSKGLGDRRQRVQPEQLLAHKLWLPPLSYQNMLAEMVSETDRSRHLHAETVIELDALLPAILDRAFKGEL